MTASYRWVQWNPHKKIYDLVLTLAAALFIAAYLAASSITHHGIEAISPPILAMRALGALGLLLLHMILCIGPLARMSTLFAPLLYNRRHLGVMFFLIVLMHASIAIGFYGGFGVRNSVSATIAGYTSFGAISSFPFEFIGFLALLIFFVMAATSHDFWLANLGPRTWKALHMLVYLAYGLVVIHVTLGPLQSEPKPLLAISLVLGIALVASLHIAAGFRESKRDRQLAQAAHTNANDRLWLEAGELEEFVDGAARIVRRSDGTSIAVFRVSNELCAVQNRCTHQGGPLGEGQIVDGCITCPWHGYQFRPTDGKSPPPYTEQISTYAVRIEGKQVMVSAEPCALESPASPATIPEEPHA